MGPEMESHDKLTYPRDVFPTDALLLRVMLLFLGTLILSLVAIFLLRQTGSTAFIWYANGLCIAIIAIAPVNQRFALTCTAFVAILASNLLVGDDVTQSLQLAFANLTTIILGSLSLAFIARQHPPFLSVKAFSLFAAFTVLLSPISGALIGSFVLELAAEVPFQQLALTWYVGDVIGILSITPLTYTLLKSRRDLPSTVNRLHTIVIMLALVAASGWVMMHSPHPYIAIAIILTLASAVLDRLSAFMTAFLVSVVLDVLLIHPSDNAGLALLPQNAISQLMPIAGVIFLSLLLAVKSAQLSQLQKISDERFTTFANAMQSSVIGMVFMMPDGSMRSPNTSFLTLTGFSRQELAKKTFRQLLFYRDKNDFYDQLNTLSDPGVDNFQTEIRLTMKNKQVIWTRFGVTPIRDNWSGEIVQYIFQIQNIDNERRQDDERNQWIKKFEFALRMNRTTLYDMECHTKFIQLSDNAHQTLGIRANHIKRLYEWMSRIHPEDLREYQHAISHVDNNTVTLEYRLMDDKNQYRWVRDHCQPIEHDANGVASRVIGTISDIQDEKSHHQNEEMATKYAELVDLVCDLGVWEYTPKTGHLYWNAKMYGLYGLHDGDPVSVEMWREQIAAKDRASLDHVFSIARQDDSLIDVNLERAGADGTQISHNILAKVIHDNKGTRLVGLCREATSLQHRNMVLSHHNAQLSAAIDIVSDGVIILDSLFHITSINERALHLTNEEKDALIGEHIDRHFTIFNRESQFTFAHLFSAYQKEFQLNGTFTLQPSQGREKQVYLEATPVIAAGDAPHGWVLSLRNVESTTKERADIPELESELKDVLTGTFSRRGFERALQHHFDTLHQHTASHSLALIEFRGLAPLANALGTAVSDQVIKSAALILKSHINKKGTLARLEKNQFIALVREHTIAQTKELVVAVIDKLNALDYPQKSTFPLDCIAGITAADSAKHTPFQLIYQAQVAADTVQENLSPAVAVFDKTSMSESITSRRNNLLQQIDTAIEKGSFSLLSMPMIPNHEGQSTWQEVLIRLITEDGRLLMPGEFLSAAEPTGRLSIIETWVFNQVLLEQGAALRDAKLNIAVNISTGAFYNERFIKNCLSMIERSALPASQLCIEVKESTLLIDVLRSKDIVSAFRKLGCEVAVDNFGAELTSFNYLRKFNVTMIKIDGAIISLMKSSQVDRRIVESIKQICQSLNIKTAAQKVNDNKELEMIREIGLDLTQGYVFGEPQPLSLLISSAKAGLLNQADHVFNAQRVNP